MINFPCAKINLGLNIVEHRNDGYHNLQTVFYPIPLKDALEISKMDVSFPSQVNCDLKVSGNSICCNESDNLIIKAYNLIAKYHKLPRIHAHLYKHIPSEAGLGGGSSDATYMIRLLNECFNLGLTITDIRHYATHLGADCPFFADSHPAYAEGIGEKLSPITITNDNLRGFYLVIIKPDVAVSTKEAFSLIKPHKPEICCKSIVCQPIETWRNRLSNDFEKSVFNIYPQLRQIKTSLYDAGAIYAQMSGSGSSLFGIFKTYPKDINNSFADCQTFVMQL